MITFRDGPAAGVELMLRRAPTYLRVVRGRTGNWDALDQIDDTPTKGETIFVYRITGTRSHYHLCARGRGKKASGYYARADYVFVPEQPADAELRETEAWRAWVIKQAQGVR
jgi:hypothetical protein